MTDRAETANTTFMHGVRAANRRLVISNVLLVLFTVLFGWFHLERFDNAFFGPFERSVDEVASIRPPWPEGRRFFRTAGDSLDSEIVESEGDDVTAVYAFVLGADRVLTVRRDPDDTGTEFVGVLRSANSDESRNVLRPSVTGPALGDRAADVGRMVLDCTRSPVSGAWIYLVVVVGALGLGARNLYCAWTRHHDPTSSPAWRRLGAFGAPAEVAAALDRELSDPRTKTWEGKSWSRVMITPSYFVGQTYWSYRVWPLTDLLWIQREVENQKVSVVTVSKAHKINARFRGLEDFECMMKEQHVRAVLMSAENMSPWTIVGYSDELDSLWSRDQAGFIAAVDERREELRDETQ